MEYFYLIGSVLFAASTSIFVSFYNKKNDGKKGYSQLYSLICLSSVFLFWLVLFLINGTYDFAVIPYSILFALCFGGCNIAYTIAFNTGSIILTSLIMQLSMIGVSCWGFIFWDAQITWLVVFGLILVAVSLWLCLYNGRKENVKKFNLTWIICAIISFATNAGCTIIQRTQQMHFEGKYAEFMMVIATAFAVLIGIFNYIKSDKQDFKVIIKTSGYLPAIAAILNGFLNLFVIFLATSTLSSSLIYPVIAVGSLAVTTVFSKFVFKEQMKWWQWLGVLVGSIAVGVLSI